VFDFKPGAIVKELDLLKPIYSKTASGGHFGKTGFAWERTDKAEELRREASGG
jgi:S-adenosylmethionine synthetase